AVEWGLDRGTAQTQTKIIYPQANSDPAACNKSAVLNTWVGAWCTMASQSWQQANADRNRMLGFLVGAHAAGGLLYVLLRARGRYNDFSDYRRKPKIDVKPEVTVTGAKDARFGLRMSW